MIQDQKNHKIMQSFSLEDIPDLDTCVLGALELFHKEKIPKIKIDYKKPLVVGSGNAEVIGRILFHDGDAVFASESTFEEKLKTIKDIDGIVIVSASGGKHAPILARLANKYKKFATLLTNNENAEAKKYVDSCFVFPKQREPYTYNVSTYLGMILGKTKENTRKIYGFINSEINELNFSRLRDYDKYFLIIPAEFEQVKRMFQIKFIELFGRKIARDIETLEYMKHATTVVPSNELFISFGVENKFWGNEENRLYVPLPKNFDYGCLMMIGYYIIGKIQKSQPPWFKENIKYYVERAGKIFNSRIEAIVE